MKYVILLRGVMPTGKNKVLMAPLREALTHVGLQEVQTYIQSGNVIAVSNLRQPDLETLVHDTIREQFGADLVVIARIAEGFREVFERNPFSDADTSKLYFTLPASPPDPDLWRDLLALDFSPDEVRGVDDVIYTLYATRYSASKYNNSFFERMLKTPTTTRNYNTMQKLVDLSSD